MSVKTRTETRRVDAASVKPESKAAAKRAPAAVDKAVGTNKRTVRPRASADTPKSSPRKLHAKAQVGTATHAARKPKWVRDDFTMPKTDFDLIDSLKRRAVSLGRPAKKSELLRAGLHALVALQDASFKEHLAALAPLKASPGAKAS